MMGSDFIPPGAHELLITIYRALEKNAGNASIVEGTLRVLLRGQGAVMDGDCRLLASVLAGAVQVSNDPEN
jgi:hypothetical protein